jgi:hypothetical protein
LTPVETFVLGGYRRIAIGKLRVSGIERNLVSLANPFAMDSPAELVPVKELSRQPYVSNMMDKIADDVDGVEFSFPRDARDKRLPAAIPGINGSPRRHVIEKSAPRERSKTSILPLT